MRTLVVNGRTRIGFAVVNRYPGVRIRRDIAENIEKMFDAKYSEIDV